MGFDIFAAGSGHFHYQMDGCIDQGTVDFVQLLAALQSMEPTRAGAAQAAAEYATPSAGITDVMGALAYREGIHNLNNAVSFLAMSSGSSDGWISLSSTNKHVLWVDTVRFARYNFSPGDDPGTEFFHTIRHALEDTNMNNWGVILKLGEVIARYSNSLDDNARPILNISITR